MAHLVPREIWDRKESQDLPASRESPAPRVSPVLRAPSAHLVKRDPRAGQGWPVYQDPMGLLVILERKVHLERREP